MHGSSGTTGTEIVRAQRSEPPRRTAGPVLPRGRIAADGPAVGGTKRTECVGAKP